MMKLKNNRETVGLVRLMSRILSLDQSTRVTGFAVFDNGSLIKVGKFDISPAGNIGDRLVRFRKKIISLIEEHDINKVCFEEIQLQNNVMNNVDTFKKLANVYGVLLETLVEINMDYEIVSSNTWKSKCGIRKLGREKEKKAAQDFVQTTYGIKVTQDEADAICLGYSSLTFDFDWSNY